MNPANQRRYFRIDKKSVLAIRECDIFEELNLLSGKKGKRETAYAKLKNISASGALTESSRPYTIGSIVKMEIVLEGWEETGEGEAIFLTGEKSEIRTIFKTVARVVRIEMGGPDLYEIGFEFIGVEKKRQEELKAYILKNLSGNLKAGKGKE